MLIQQALEGVAASSNTVTVFSPAINVVQGMNSEEMPYPCPMRNYLTWNCHTIPKIGFPQTQAGMRI